MRAKPAVPRATARHDIDDAIDHYLKEAGDRVALRFIDAVAAAFRAIEQSPGGGSPRYAYELDLPGLRSRQMKRFPYLVFYVEREHRIDVWRVLHANRDIPAWLQEPTED